jgi:hypothetical protein
MNKRLGTTLSLLGALVLFSAIAPAKTTAEKTDKQEHQGKFSKVAFWRHNKSTKSAKTVASKPAAKNAAATHMTPKVTPAKASATKQVSVKKDQPSAKSGKAAVKAVPAAKSKVEKKESKAAKTLQKK